MNRRRVQHAEYKWMGEYYVPAPDGDVPAAWLAGWVTVRWDDGRETREHTDDLIRREGASA